MADPLQTFMQQNKGLLSFEPTEDDRKKALTYGLIGAGLGILSANAQNPRGAGFAGAVGGAAPGLAMYQQTLQNAPKERMQNLAGMMQMRGLQSSLARDEAMRNLQFKDPAAQQLAAAGLFADAIKRENPEQKFMGVGENLVDVTPGRTPTSVFAAPPKPQLVQVPVQGQPGVTQPTWMRPGEASGTAIGGMNMPDILNPDVQRARRDVAKAGAPSVSVKVDQKTGESFAKEIGPMMTESRAAASGAVDAIGTAERVKNALSQGNVTLGPTATIRNKADQIAQIMGVGGADTEERLINTRNVMRGLSQFALQARKQLKGQGQVSDYEGRLIQRAEAGEIEDFTLPELKDFIGVTEKLARKTYSEHQRNIEVMNSNPELQRFVPFYSVPELPQSAATAPTAPKVKRFNPKTGKIE
jgi:hypothetical protein